MKNSIFILLTLLFTLSACRRDLPLPVGNEPVFAFEAQLNGQMTKLVAGEDNYYLNSDHQVDANQVREFRGTFEPVGCTDCPESMRIVFRDYQRTPNNEPVELDSVFKKGEYYFYRGEVPEPDRLTFRFRGHSGGTPPFQYEWDFGDGHTSREAEPTHSYTGEDAFIVKLKVQDANGCYNESRHEVPTGDLFNDCDFRYTYTYDPANNSTLHFAVNLSQATSPFPLVLWSFGDGTVTAGEYAPTHTYAEPGIYEVKMILVQANGDRCCDIQNVYTEPHASCATSIAYKASNPEPELSRVYLEWRDENGALYSTDNFYGQPTESYFELLSWEPYEEDLDKQKTIKAALRFQCRLFREGDETDFIDLRGGEAVLAVAYP